MTVMITLDFHSGNNCGTPAFTNRLNNSFPDKSKTMRSNDSEFVFVIMVASLFLMFKLKPTPSDKFSVDVDIEVLILYNSLPFVASRLERKNKEEFWIPRGSTEGPLLELKDNDFILFILSRLPFKC